MHAASYQFGWAIEILKEAIGIAAESGRTDELTRQHFALEYAGRTGNAAFANPFLAQEWATLDPRRCNITRPEQIVREAPPPPSGQRGRRVAK